MRVHVAISIVLSCSLYVACARGSRTAADGDDKADCRARKAAARLAGEDDGALGLRGGRLAGKNEFPYVGLLMVDEGKASAAAREARVCSASLLCSNVVLTAAHCFDAGAKADTYVFFQSAQATSAKATSLPSIMLSLPQLLLPGAKNSASARAARGRRFEILSAQGLQANADLALLQLDRKLSGQFANLATSALDAEKHDGATATIVGYGATGTKNGQDVGAGTKKVGTMRFAGYFHAPDNKTLHGLGKLYPAEGIEASDGSSDNACPGDSGGATVLGDKVFGVVSRIMNWRDGKIQNSPTCASANITLFTSIPHQIEWINSHVQKMCADPFDLNTSGVPADAAKPASATVDASAEGDDDC